MCPIAHMSKKDVKLSKRCQVVKKMSNVKKSNTWTMEEVHKIINWHNEVHTYWHLFWHHIWWWPKTLKMCIENVFEQFWWPSYLMSKLTLNMCEPHYVNLFFLWTSSIVHVFDFLTFDIFLTNCHLFDILTSFNLNHLSPSQGYFFVLIFLWNGESYSPIWSIANSVGNNVSPLFFGFTSVIPITIGFLGGLSLHLNHLNLVLAVYVITLTCPICRIYIWIIKVASE